MSQIHILTETPENWQLLQTLVQKSSDLLGVVTVTGTILFFNKDGNRFWVESDKEEISFFDGVVREQRDWLRAVIWPQLLSEGRWEGICRLNAHDTGEEMAVILQLQTAADEKVLVSAQIVTDVDVQASVIEAQLSGLTGQEQRYEMLAQVSLAINQSYELEKLLQHIVDVTTQFLPATGGASIILWSKVDETFTVSASSVVDQPAGIGTRRARRTGGATRWIIDSRQPLLVPDIRDDPFSANQMLTDYSLQAYAGVPLLANNEVLGVLYALDKEVRPYTVNDVRFLEAVASRAALAISKVRLYEGLRQQKELFENLVAVAHASIQQPDLTTTLQNILQITTELATASEGSLFLMDAQKQVVRSLIVPTNNDTAAQMERAQTAVKTGLAGWVLRHGQIANITDTQTDERWHTFSDELVEARSVIGLPIGTAGAVTGILTLMHGQPYHFTTAHTQFLQAAASQLALVIKNAQLFDQQQGVIQRQTAVYKILAAIGKELTPQAVLSTAVDILVRETAWNNVAIVLPSEDQRFLRVEIAGGVLAATQGLEISVTEGVVGHAFTLSETLYVPDVKEVPAYIEGHPEIRCELAIPLMYANRVLGVLDIQGRQYDQFIKEDRILAESLAGAIALALNNATLYDDMQIYLTDLGALYRITQVVTRSLNLMDVLNEALVEMIASLNFECGLISLIEPPENELRLIVAHHLPPSLLHTLKLEGFEGTLCAYVQQRQQSIVFEEKSDTTRMMLPAKMLDGLKQFNFHTYAGTPLLHQGYSLGTICLFIAQPRALLTVSPSLLEAIGSQIATAIVNMRLYQSLES